MGSARMSTIERYLATQLTGGILIAALVLIPLFGFFDLVEQLEDVGEGFYRTQDAFAFVALLQPRRFIQLAPFIALLGTVIALGRLAVANELVAMRSAGLSPAQLGRAVLIVGGVILVVLGLLEQFVAPPMQQSALARRSAALEQRAELGKDLGIWTRDAGSILRIGSMERDDRPSDIEILRFDERGQLREYLRAERAEIESDAEWRLQSVTARTIEGLAIRHEVSDAVAWTPFLDAGQIATLTRPPESLSPVELFRHVRYLRSTGQQSDAYALAFWRKPGGMLTTLAMLMLALPFALAPPRTGLGLRLVMAALTGVGVYLADQILANAGLLLELDPVLVGLAPGMVLLALAVQFLRRLA
jgi:lipopolysaccharide export system permease protein